MTNPVNEKQRRRITARAVDLLRETPGLTQQELVERWELIVEEMDAVRAEELATDPVSCLQRPSGDELIEGLEEDYLTARRNGHGREFAEELAEFAQLLAAFDVRLASGSATDPS